MTTARSSKKSLLVAAAAAGMVAAPLIWVARAQPPASEPAAPRAASEDPKSGQEQPKDRAGDHAAADSRPKVRRDGPPVGGWGGGPFVPGWGPRAPGMRPPPEWSEVSSFMSRYAPWGTREVNQMPEGDWKERIKAGLTQRYRALRLLEGRDTETYEQRLAQLGIEDEALRLVSTLGAADDAQREAIREELRTRAARLVELDIEERQRRVQRLEDELKKQKDALDRDTAGRDGLVDKRVKGFMDWGKRWAANRARAEKIKARSGATAGGVDGKVERGDEDKKGAQK